jgi:hypothetical protein
MNNMGRDEREREKIIIKIEKGRFCCMCVCVCVSVFEEGKEGKKKIKSNKIL